ncbi:MAG: hypothetical protein GY851_07275 [bacterium]|nr:hypothetical protein [bacterium]
MPRKPATKKPAAPKKKKKARAGAPHDKPPPIQEQIDALMAAGWAAFANAQEQATKLKPMAALEFYRRALDIARELREREGGAIGGSGFSIVIPGFNPDKIVTSGTEDAGE